MRDDVVDQVRCGLRQAFGRHERSHGRLQTELAASVQVIEGTQLAHERDVSTVNTDALGQAQQHLDSCLLRGSTSEMDAIPRIG